MCFLDSYYTMKRRIYTTRDIYQLSCYLATASLLKSLLLEVIIHNIQKEVSSVWVKYFMLLAVLLQSLVHVSVDLTKHLHKSNFEPKILHQDISRYVFFFRIPFFAKSVLFCCVNISTLCCGITRVVLWLVVSTRVNYIHTYDKPHGRQQYARYRASTTQKHRDTACLALGDLNASVYHQTCVHMFCCVYASFGVVYT